MDCEFGAGTRRAPAQARRPASCLVHALWLCVSLSVLLCGCVTSRPPAATEARAFDFSKDTFAYANELTWTYHTNAAGKWVGAPREPRPDYTLHCFVVVHAARQFFENARFVPDQPAPNAAACRKLVHRVLTTHSGQGLPAAKRINIPGYADLREFSAACEPLLKSECGGAWHSYVQRGNWRMVFPFSRASQAKTARRLVTDLNEHRLPIVHLVRFPQLTINHAMLLFADTETPDAIEFSAYDPNQPDQPTALVYHRQQRTFTLPANNYFPGGRVDVYEVYRNLIY